MKKKTNSQINEELKSIVDLHGKHINDSLLAKFNNKFPSQTQDKFTVRFPDGMRNKIAERASQNGRSMNSEIIHILQQYIDSTYNDPIITVQHKKEDNGTVTIKKAELISIHEAILNAIEKSQDNNKP